MPPEPIPALLATKAKPIAQATQTCCLQTSALMTAAQVREARKAKGWEPSETGWVVGSFTIFGN